MLPAAWRTVSLFNPVVYLVSGFRWSFFGTADVAVGVSLAMTVLFLRGVRRCGDLDAADRAIASSLERSPPAKAGVVRESGRRIRASRRSCAGRRRRVPRRSAAQGAKAAMIMRTRRRWSEGADSMRRVRGLRRSYIRPGPCRFL